MPPSEDSAFAFEVFDTGVAIPADDQRFAQAARLLQAANMAGVEQIEAAVGEDDAAAIAFPAAKPQNRLLQCEDGIQRVSVRALPEQIVKPEVVVYHAGLPRRAAQVPPVVVSFENRIDWKRGLQTTFGYLKKLYPCWAEMLRWRPK
jgi:hypothetical protein